MDIVITYVNGADPEWLRSYSEFCDKPVIAKRYRDWGTLRYLLRAIDVNLPFVNRVFLVVSDCSQVPDWVSPRLDIVLHKDIIPEEFLPTFNSTTIEMFLHRIPGLDEEFVYFNDDIFPLLPCSPEDFFRDGKAVMDFHKCLLKNAQYRKHAFNSDRLARKALGKPAGLLFLRPKHSATTMLKSVLQEAYDKSECEIRSRISPLRENYNLNQYYFLDYQLLSGHCVGGAISKKHFSLAIATRRDMREFFRSPSSKLVGINDTKVSSEKFKTVKSMLEDCFCTIFPEKSRFEK